MSLTLQQHHRAARDDTRHRPRDEAGGGAGTVVHRGGEPETDATRCALARAVAEGTVRHVNDLPIDQHDRDVANNDIRSYCR